MSMIPERDYESGVMEGRRQMMDEMLKAFQLSPTAALVERATPTRRWRCPDCGIPNLWEALECVRCRLISPPDKERWEFKPFVRSDRERLTDSTAVAVQAQAQKPLEVLIASWRESATEFEHRKDEAIAKNFSPGADINRAKMLAYRLCADDLETALRSLKGAAQ